MRRLKRRTEKRVTVDLTCRTPAISGWREHAFDGSTRDATPLHDFDRIGVSLRSCCFAIWPLDHSRMIPTADGRLRPNLSHGNRIGSRFRILIPNGPHITSHDPQAVVDGNERSLSVAARVYQCRSTASVPRHVRLRTIIDLDQRPKFSERHA